MPESKASMARILIVEDNRHLLETLTEQLGLEPGFEIGGVATLAEAREEISRRPPDMLLLDASLPDGDGRSLCRWFRGKGHDAPILMLTDRGGEMEPIDGLEAGADEYIAKPLRVRELAARVRNHLGRRGPGDDARIAIGPFLFSPNGKTLAHPESGESRDLTEKEAAIIGYLAGRDGGTVGREELLSEVWGYGDGVTTHTLETHIYRLRRKMAGMDKARVLLTDGGGYKLG